MSSYTTQALAEAAAIEESAKMLVSGDVIEFDGQNCEYTLEGGAVCEGWDGNDRRCECGNRRVGWSFTECPKGVFSYYAEAY